MVLLDLARRPPRWRSNDVAVISLRKLVQLEPGNADALWELAETYGDKHGMTGKGTAAYRDFERLFPSDPGPRRSRRGEGAGRGGGGAAAARTRGSRSRGGEKRT
jgi:hypothetical protein